MPQFVFSVVKVLEAVATQQNADVDSSIASSESEHQMEMDEPVVTVNGDEEVDAAIALPRHRADHRPEAVRARTSSLSSLSSFSLCSFDNDYHHVSPPGPTGDEMGPLSSNEKPTSTPFPIDCQSTAPSLRYQTHSRNESDVDSLPSLQEILSNDGSSIDNEPKHLPSVSNHPVHIAQDEMDTQITRFAWPPSTPNHHSWPLLTEWSHKQTSFVSRVHNIQHNDALSFIRQATALVDQFPEILDVLRMAANKHINVDTANESAEADILDEGCARFAKLVQTIRDTVDA
ncbi:hypothetical protein DFH06DRAFT_1340675 [Mycena polygramma]|nr:hypothetical protein DFH06DRAFT_1340675 [Mycena polygramma]